MWFVEAMEGDEIDIKEIRNNAEMEGLDWENGFFVAFSFSSVLALNASKDDDVEGKYVQIPSGKFRNFLSTKKEQISFSK